MRPKFWPLREVQKGPSGPSLTKGMRSFIAADALDVNRSGGIQGRSMWQSAEILEYGMVSLLSHPRTLEHVRNVFGCGLAGPRLDLVHGVDDGGRHWCRDVLRTALRDHVAVHV